MHVVSFLLLGRSLPKSNMCAKYCFSILLEKSTETGCDPRDYPEIFLKAFEIGREGKGGGLKIKHGFIESV